MSDNILVTPTCVEPQSTAQQIQLETQHIPHQSSQETKDNTIDKVTDETLGLSEEIKDTKLLNNVKNSSHCFWEASQSLGRNITDVCSIANDVFISDAQKLKIYTNTIQKSLGKCGS